MPVAADEHVLRWRKRGGRLAGSRMMRCGRRLKAVHGPVQCLELVSWGGCCAGW